VRPKKKVFLKNFEDTIKRWTEKNEKNILNAYKSYSWKGKSFQDSLDERNRMEKEIKLSRKAHGGGIDLSTVDKF
jgi:hypothetical protein